MKIAYIYGNMTHYDHGLSKLLERTKNIFSELEAEVETIDLGALHPPYYDGETTNGLDAVLEKLRVADGIIFASTAQMFAPTALMQSFLEYLEHSEYAGVLREKHCMLILLSRDGGEKSAMDYLSRIIGHHGGFVAAQIGLQARHLGDGLENETGEFVDKAAEDFYRAVHKKRGYIIPADFAASVGAQIVQAAQAATQSLQEEELVKPENLKSQLSDFNESQEKEIEELSAMFSQKYNPDGVGIISAAKEVNSSPVSASISSAYRASPGNIILTNPPATTIIEASGEAEKLTEALPKNFQAQLSAGLQAIVQISITGDEAFDGFLNIHSTECTFSKGTAPAPDIIIMADTAVWLDVLTSRTTAQKAFMVGGIKVRGDFVLLSKFDTLFGISK